MGLLKTLISYMVEIRAPTDGLRTDLRQAETETRASAQRMAAASTVSGGVIGAAGAGRGLAASLKEATAPARQILGAITSTVGIITRSLGLIGLVTSAAYGLYSVISSIGKASERTANTWEGLLDKMRDPVLFEKKTADDIERAKNKYDELVEARRKDIAEATKAAYQEESFNKILQKRLRISNEIGEYNRLIQREAEAGKRYQPWETRLDALREEFRFLNKQIEERENSVVLARSEAWKGALKSAQEDIDAAQRGSIDNLNKKRIESARQEAKMIEDAYSRAAESMRSVVASSFGQQSYSIQRIEQALMRMSSQLQLSYQARK